VPLPPQRDKSRPEILRSPVWDAALTQTRAKIDGLPGSDQAQRSRSPTLARESASAVLARAHTRLLAALGASRAQGTDTVSELVGAAVALVGAVPLLWSTHSVTGYEHRLPMIADALERQLSSHEHGVLSGDLTYSLSVAEAEQPAVRMRHSLAELASRDHGAISDLISVQIAAIELATLLVRAAGNVLTHARAAEAPEKRTPAVDRALLRVEREIATHAKAHTRALGMDNDVVGQSLAQALHACEPARQPHTGAADRGTLVVARNAWLDVAAREHVIVAALDAKLATPTYRPHYETVGIAITETGANILCNARLIARANAFRHDEAWREQSTALSSVRETYINGPPGASDGLDRAQEIVLTRLVRAAVAITLIDLRGHVAEPGNGHPLRAA
jgi:hypothetical protein